MPEKDIKTKLEEFVKKQEETLAEFKATAEKTSENEDKIKVMNDDIGELKKYVNQVVNNIGKMGVSIGMDEKDTSKFSFAKALCADRYGNWEKAGYEREVIQETKSLIGEKAIDTNTGAGGGFTIPTELAVNELIKPALANTVMDKLGVKKLTGLTGEVDLPEATSRPSLTFGADGATVTAEDITWATKKLRPKFGKMLAKVSNNLLIQQSAMESWVRGLMTEGLTNGIDKYAIIGTGSDSEPRGILNYSGTNTTAIGGVRMTIDHVLGMIEDIEEQDFMPNGFLSRSKVKSFFMRERVPQYSGDTAGALTFEPWRKLSTVEDFLGLKVAWSSNVTVASNLTSAVVGAWNEFVLGFWGNIRMKASDLAGTALETDQTWIAMYVNFDTALRRPLAFDIASNVSTT